MLQVYDCLSRQIYKRTALTTKFEEIYGMVNESVSNTI